MKKILEKIGDKVSLQVVEVIDPKEYFQNREGLYVWSSFKDRILSKADQLKENSSFDIEYFKLTSDADDEKIEGSLPEKHLFTESEVCAIVAELISKQPKGEEGTLINNGYANLFYTGAFVVGVGWNGGAWYVDAWGRDGDGWRDGGRVFSPATDN